MNNYLIPANTKRGSLILGLFRPLDIIIFGIGIFVTLILLLIIPVGDTVVTIMILSPALVTGFLVMPVRYYHNMLTIVIELFEFLTNRQTYKWKGWCYKSGKK